MVCVAVAAKVGGEFGGGRGTWGGTQTPCKLDMRLLSDVNNDTIDEASGDGPVTPNNGNDMDGDSSEETDDDKIWAGGRLISSVLDDCRDGGKLFGGVTFADSVLPINGVVIVVEDDGDGDEGAMLLRLRYASSILNNMSSGRIFS